ncbi:MAG: glucose-methanol-choline oxidoreductase [Gammaproteobacteria bacterium]|nr:MAG: glucose-methanol-choline oxidoreductase [Gammaproteobacteria bacterium]
MEFDFIIAGAGTAGCVIANRLTADPKRSVLVLEGGRADTHLYNRIPAANIKAVQNPAFDWCYRTEPDPSRNGLREVWPAGKLTGGGSAMNGMIFIRGHYHDFDRWAELGADGWDYKSILPYFKRLETNSRGGNAFRGADGPLSVSDLRVHYPVTDAWIAAAVEAGIKRSPDLNGEQCEGVDYIQASQRRGLRDSTASAYLWPASRRENLKLELKAVIRRVLVRDGRAVGVEYSQAGVTRTAMARQGVAICSGAMGSPKLLLLSGIGPGSHLQELGIPVAVNLPGVGANLQDHIGMHHTCEVNQPTMNSERGPLDILRHGLNFLLRRRGVLTTSIGHAHALVKTRPGLPGPNVQLIMAPMAFDLDEQGVIRLCKEPAISTAIGVIHPRARGRISLRSPDPMDPPKIEHALIGEADDVEQLVEGMQMARRIVAQPAINKCVVRERTPGDKAQSDAELREFAHLAAFSMYHQAGTCRMGKDNLAVVDPQLRVRGVEGLWVADASIMPELVSGNTNASVIMIGEKAADLIQSRL